jgi:carbon starvation protein CstA
MTHIETRYLEENYCEKVVKRPAVSMETGLTRYSSTLGYFTSNQLIILITSCLLLMYVTHTKNGSFHFPSTLPSVFVTKIKFYTHSWRSRLGYSAKHEKWYIAFFNKERVESH